MKKLRLLVLVLIVITLLIGLSFYLVGVLKPKSTGIIVHTDPTSIVFINGEEFGRTPFETKKLKPSEIVLRLIPESFGSPLLPYETKLDLKAGVQTLVKRKFGKTQEESSGGIISFEKVTKGETEVVVVSIPDTAQVKIDGQVKGFTPYKTSSILPGEHTITVSFQGYLEETFEIKVYDGYKSTIIVDLAKSQQAEPTSFLEEEPKEENPKEVVEIITTPVGYLRVRKEPSTLGEEIGRVNPGERYEVLEIDQQTGWYKIEYEEGKEGWVSNQYAKRVGEEGEVSPTITNTKTPTKTPTTTP